MQQLKAVSEKRKSLDTKTRKLLQKAIPSAQPPAKNLTNRVKNCHFCDRRCYKLVFRELCFVDAVMHGLICNVEIHKFSLPLIDIGTEHLWI